MKAEDVMVRNVVCAGPEDLVRDVAARMLEGRYSGLPVVDADGRVLGIISESDLIRRPEIETDHAKRGWLYVFLSSNSGARDFVKSHGRLAREVMTQPAICVDSQAPLAEVVRLMERHRIRRMPVLGGGKHGGGTLVGLLTRADLLRAVVQRQAMPAPAQSDEQLRAGIASLLREEAWAASAFVHAQVEQGVAQLWGTVESADQREALILAVSSLPGVKEVRAHLGKIVAG